MTLAPILAALFGCTREPVTTPADTDQAHDTAQPDTTEPASVVVSDVNITMSEAIGTVAQVTFAAAGEGSGVVVFGEEGGASYRVSAAAQDDGTWRAVLVGVPADASGWLQVGLDDVLDETVHTYQTQSAPTWLQTELTGTVETEGFYALAVMGEAKGIVIVTSDGRPVWWWPAPKQTSSILSRVQLSADHSTVWLNAFTIESYDADDDGGQLIAVALDGSSEEVISLPTTHHDFLVRSDDTIAIAMLDDREVNGRIVRGDAIVEIAPSGEQRTVWSSWDAIPYSGQQSSPSDWWTMLNHLQWDAASNDYVASLKNMTTLVRVDGETGETEWIMSTDTSFATLVPDDSFYHQHGLHISSDDELLLFDNDGARGHSRVIRMALDMDAQRAETLAIYDGDVASLIMGDVVEVDSGNLLICYSSEARLDETTAAGEVISQLSFPNMVNVGYIEHLPAIGADAVRR